MYISKHARELDLANPFSFLTFLYIISFSRSDGAGSGRAERWRGGERDADKTSAGHGSRSGWETVSDLRCAASCWSSDEL